MTFRVSAACETLDARSSQSIMSLAVGEVIGDYEVIGHLGAGGMGDVYRVRHVISERVEALKLLLDSQIGSG
ncbi:MAG TPA: hypothetical protein VD758_14405, partial [Gemmatimonadaceae bacterium]|nr:hypothetical protein [Gemmatimonadaceae bacterium]